jgi:DNA-binding transcriptional regulator GbsR (MarR family)
MQYKRTFFEDTLTGKLHITRPKLANMQYENEKGIVGASRNARKVTLFCPRTYMEEYETLYSLTINELGYIYSLSKYIGRDNMLFIGDEPLCAETYAEKIGVHKRSVEKVFKTLIDKNILRRVRKGKTKRYMVNPIFGCSRNYISYATYYVFRDELNAFFSATNQNFRMENIDKHFSLHKDEVEREIEIL